MIWTRITNDLGGDVEDLAHELDALTVDGLPGRATIHEGEDVVGAGVPPRVPHT